MRRIVTVSIGLLLLVGCGSSSKRGAVTGTITYKGNPVNGATLLLHPSGGKGTDAIPVIAAQDGTFRTSDVPPGDYKIVVQGDPGPGDPPGIKNMPADKQAEARSKWEASHSGQKATIAFPAKYKDLASTDLTCTVTTGGETKLTVELKD
jgi:hypothetical protein